MIGRVFHEWERRLAAAAENRIVRPFEWGLEWLADLAHGHGKDEWAQLEGWAAERVTSSDSFFAVDPCKAYELDGDLLRFPSAVTTPHPENNIVRARYFPTRRRAAEGARCSSCRSGMPIRTDTSASAGC